jgi:hypothetical protein
MGIVFPWHYLLVGRPPNYFIKCHILVHRLAYSNMDNYRGTYLAYKVRCIPRRRKGIGMLLPSTWLAHSIPVPDTCHCRRNATRRNCRLENGSIRL